MFGVNAAIVPNRPELTGGSHVAEEEEEEAGRATQQAVAQPISELLVAMEQAAAELEPAATEQPAVQQPAVEQTVADQPVRRVRLVMKARDEATTGGAVEEQAVATRVPLTSEQALQQAQAEGITLRVGDNTTGYFGVCLEASRSLPFRAQFKRSGQKVTLGHFATAEEAALCVARSPEGQQSAVAAEVAAAAAPPLTSEAALQQAQAEGLPLLKVKSTTGYFGVHFDSRSQARPFIAKVWRDSKQATLGQFATAEQAALIVAQSLEGRAAAQRAAAHAEGLTPRVPENRTAGCSGACLCPQREQAIAELRALLAAQEDAITNAAAETSGVETSCLEAAQERHDPNPNPNPDPNPNPNPDPNPITLILTRNDMTQRWRRLSDLSY